MTPTPRPRRPHARPATYEEWWEEVLACEDLRVYEVNWYGWTQ